MDCFKQELHTAPQFGELFWWSGLSRPDPQSVVGSVLARGDSTRLRLDLRALQPRRAAAWPSVSQPSTIPTRLTGTISGASNPSTTGTPSASASRTAVAAPRGVGRPRRPVGDRAGPGWPRRSYCAPSRRQQLRLGSARAGGRFTAGVPTRPNCSKTARRSGFSGLSGCVSRSTRRGLVGGSPGRSKIAQSSRSSRWRDVKVTPSTSVVA